MGNRHMASLDDQGWTTVRNIFWSHPDLNPVDSGPRALGMQFSDAPSPHAINVDVKYDAGKVEVVFHGGSEAQRRSVLDVVEQSARARGIVVEWRE